MTDEIIRKLDYVITKLEILEDRTSKESARTLKNVRKKLRDHKK